MNVNVSKVSNEEEILLWYEKFPDFVKFLKLIIVNSGHFEIFYENNKSCLFESKLKYKSFWDGKWYDYSFIDNTGLVKENTEINSKKETFKSYFDR